MIQDLGWWKTPLRDWHTVALPSLQIQADSLFAWSAPVMNPQRLARKEPNLCDTNALDIAGYRCIFWGPLTGPGVTTKKRRLLSLCNRRLFFFLTDLDPDGCLVADQLKVYAKHLKYRVQINKRGYFRAGWWPCKKLYYFCDGLVFFIDRGLLMGA